MITFNQFLERLTGDTFLLLKRELSISVVVFAETYNIVLKFMKHFSMNYNMEFSTQCLLSAVLSLLIISTVNSQAAPGTPAVTGFPNNAIVGELITATCTSVGGNPDPTMSWYQNSTVKQNTYTLEVSGNVRTTMSNYSFIVIRAHENTDFYCRAGNNQANVTTLKRFSAVYVTPGNPTLTGSATLSAGTSNTWHCQTVGGYPTPSIAWYFGGVVVTADLSNVTTSQSTYTVDSWYTRTVQAADNAKLLECRVSHPQTLTTPKITTKTLTVYSAPTVAITPDQSNELTGNNLTLTCSVTSSLVNYTVTWYKEGSSTALTSGSNYVVTGNTVTILNAASALAGNYYCTATNSAGTSSNSNNVNVVLYTIPTNAVITPTSVTVEQGQSFSVSCAATASPLNSLSYSWEFGSSVLSTNSELNVTNAQKEDSGSYICTATNSYGNTTEPVTVDVQYAPESTVTDPSVTATVGTNYPLSCDTDANPEASSFVWYEGSTLLSITEKENSVSVVSGDTTYTCQASNTVGQSGDIVFTITGTGTDDGGTPDTGASTGDTGTGLSVGVIVAIVLGILLILFIIILIIVCCICSGSCRKKEKKKKGRVTPKAQPVAKPPMRQPAYVENYSTPRNKPRPNSFNPSIISRKHVDVDMESSDGYGYGIVYGDGYPADTHRSTTSRFVLRAPPTAVESEDGTIISVYDDSNRLVSKRKRPVHLTKEHTYDELEQIRRRERRRRKKKRHHKREAGEGEESPPRKERKDKEETEHRDSSPRRREKRDESKRRRSRRERREEETEELGEHGYISEGSPDRS